VQGWDRNEIEVHAVKTAKHKESDLEREKTRLSSRAIPAIDCFVELMGGSGEPALSAIEAALKSGKSVVTANKALIAKHGPATGEVGREARRRA